MNDYTVTLPNGNVLTRIENGIFLLTKGDTTMPISRIEGELLLIDVIESQKELLKDM